MNVEKICFIKYMKYSLGANIQKEKLKIKAINTVSMINMIGYTRYKHMRGSCKREFEK